MLRLEFLGPPHQDFHLCDQPRGFGQDGFVLLLQSFAGSVDCNLSLRSGPMAEKCAMFW